METCCLEPTITTNSPMIRMVAQAVTAYNGVSLKIGGTLDADISWINQIAKGNTTAFEALCRSYQNRLLGYLFRLLGSRDQAEEVLNEVFWGIWQSAPRFKGEASPATWIFRIARNRAASRLHKRDRRLSDDEVADQEDPRQEVENALVRRELVQDGLKRLSREHREVMELTFFVGLSYHEIADVVACPVNTVKTRMFHAKQQLRTFMERKITREVKS